MTELKTKIIESLTRDNIKMIPKWRLILYSFGFVTALLFLFLIVIFTLSLIFFVLSRYGFMYLPVFGFMTIIHTLKAVPLLLLLCTVVLLIVIEVVSRKYAFSFKRPLALTLLFTTSLAVVFSFLVGVTPMHEYIRDYAREHDITVMSDVYRRPLPLRTGGDVTILRGSVLTSSTTFITLELFDGVEVKAYASTSLKGITLPRVDDDVLLFGSFVGSNFVMIGIKNAPNIPFEKRKRERGMRESMKTQPNQIQTENEINMFRGR